MSEITHEISLDTFHKQVSYVLNSYKSHGLKSEQFRNIIIGGLGGSGIGGRIAKLAFFTASPLPIEVISEYMLPSYANEKTLVILCSYSGNTEETLAMFEDAKQKKCNILVLSSGGELTKLCAEQGYFCYPLETGYQPRMALGYSLSTLLLVLGELTSIDMRTGLMQVADMLADNQSMKQNAWQMFEYFKDTCTEKFVVVCDMAFEGVATRFCQQIQENAKGEAFISVLPEANHNMIESYYGHTNTNFIFLYSGLNPKVGKRFDFLKTVLENQKSKIYHFPIEVFNLRAIFEVIHTTDWLSIYISNEKQVDNMVVGNIARLKNFLGE